jgi:hypothetical protein
MKLTMTRIDPTCLICGGTPTVKSHLLPAAVGRDIKGDDKSFWVGSKRHDGKTISQSGIFDRFLCEAHERAFHRYEDTTLDFCRTLGITPDEQRVGAFLRHDTDNEAVIRFACSVLWRYHQSGRIEASAVDVGGWEPVLRRITFDGDMTGAPDVITTSLHTQFIPVDRFAISPSRSKFDDRVIWNIVMYGLAMIVKLDKRPFPTPGVQAAVINGRNFIAGRVQPFSMEDARDMKVISKRMMLSGPMRRGS